MSGESEVAMNTLSQADGVGEDVRQTMDVDIACAGFGPAMGGFLTTLARAWNENPGDPAFESTVMPGMPLQVMCYERADDLAAGVSGVVTKARGIRCELSGSQAGRHSDGGGGARGAGALSARSDWREPALRWPALWRIRFCAGWAARAGVKDSAFELPWTPGFLHKHGGLVLSMGQFNQWVASQLMADGLVQIWPGTPVAGATD